MSRRAGSKIKLFHQDGRLLRHIGVVEAEGLIDAMCAVGAYNEQDQLVSVRLTNRESKRLPMASGLGMFEMQANACIYGSPMAFLGASDPVQEVMDKVTMWPFEGDRKAIRVMPRVCEADIERAVQALARAKRPLIVNIK